MIDINHQTEYAKYVFENGFQSDNNLMELKFVAIYMRDILLYKPKKRKAEIIGFCAKYYNDFKERRDYWLVKKSLNYSLNKKNILIDFDNIILYNNEMEFISKQNISDDAKRLLVALLIEHKKSEHRYILSHDDDYTSILYGGNSTKYNYIKKVSHIVSSQDINYLIGIISEDVNLIDNKATHGLFKLTFLSQIKEHDSVWKIVKDFENLGWYYDLYIENKKVGVCEQCNKLFKITGKNQKYCKDCAINIDKEKNKIRVQNFRNHKV